MGSEETVWVDGRRLTLRNLDKPFWPDDGLTKGHMVQYYEAVADAILPHLEGRPLVVTRYPDGIHGEWFYQKNRPPGTPEWVPLWPYYSQESRRWLGFVVCRDRATLVWLANQAAIELHPWYSPCMNPEEPDFCVIDLDPMEPATFDDARDVALVLREYLERRGVRAFLKTSGATGLHVYVPLRRGYTYRQTSEAVRRLAVAFVRMWPERCTVERMVNKRGGKVYIDYLQNHMGKTLCAPYSLRPRPGAPVSCPLDWSELASVDPAYWNLRSVPERLRRRGDPWRNMLQERQPLELLVGERIYV
ncbi:MAG: non-homologous end-joining DNA ligase [Clostridia bacterium]|nr:non-homologous end-joining DNA ligase [Clostridia bacterium]